MNHINIVPNKNMFTYFRAWSYGNGQVFRKNCIFPIDIFSHHHLLYLHECMNKWKKFKCFNLIISLKINAAAPHLHFHTDGNKNITASIIKTDFSMYRLNTILNKFVTTAYCDSNLRFCTMKFQFFFDCQTSYLDSRSSSDIASCVFWVSDF